MVSSGLYIYYSSFYFVNIYKRASILHFGLPFNRG